MERSAGATDSCAIEMKGRGTFCFPDLESSFLCRLKFIQKCLSYNFVLAIAVRGKWGPGVAWVVIYYKRP